MTQKIIRVTDETKRAPTADEWEIFLEKRIPELIRRMKEGALHPETINSSLQGMLEGWGMKRGILNPIASGIKFPGCPAFRVADKMELIKYRGSNFTEWFGGMKVPAASTYDLDENELTERAVDTPIIAELGEENCETSVGVLFWGIETGYWSKDRWYLLYVKDKNGVRRAVYWRWAGDGWGVGADRVGDPDEWDAGDHAVSRTPLVA